MPELVNKANLLEEKKKGFNRFSTRKKGNVQFWDKSISARLYLHYAIETIERKQNKEFLHPMAFSRRVEWRQV